MKLKCPACGTPVPAENINIRSMSALCTHCDSVFTFRPTDSRPARKLKAPKQITTHIDSDDALHFSFKWSWRTEPPIAMAAMLVMMIGLTIALIATLSTANLEVLPLLLALGIFPTYVLSTIALNSTHYHIESDQLRVYTGPLPFVYYGSHSIPLWDISDVTTVQAFTMPGASSREAFYNVYVHTSDGDRLMVARLVNYDHAHYIAQELQAFLDTHDTQQDSYFDLSPESRLADDLTGGDTHDVDEEQQRDTGR